MSRPGCFTFFSVPGINETLLNYIHQHKMLLFIRNRGGKGGGGNQLLPTEYKEGTIGGAVIFVC